MGSWTKPAKHNLNKFWKKKKILTFIFWNSPCRGYYEREKPFFPILGIDSLKNIKRQDDPLPHPTPCALGLGFCRKKIYSIIVSCPTLTLWNVCTGDIVAAQSKSDIITKSSPTLCSVLFEYTGSGPVVSYTVPVVVQLKMTLMNGFGVLPNDDRNFRQSQICLFPRPPNLHSSPCDSVRGLPAVLPKIARAPVRTAWRRVSFQSFSAIFYFFKSLFSTKNIVNFELIFCGALLLTLNYESSKEFLKKNFSIFAPKHPTVLERPYWLAPLGLASLVRYTMNAGCFSGITFLRNFLEVSPVRGFSCEWFLRTFGGFSGI